MRILILLFLMPLMAACCQTDSKTSTEKSNSTASLAEKKARLGKQLFFDTNLSEPAGQSCASCHSPAHGFADPNQNLPVSAGAVKGKFAPRNTPTIAYAKFSPALHINEEGIYVGGQFWDGREDDLASQAAGPLLNEAEMNNVSEAAVVEKVNITHYRSQFDDIYGDGALKSDQAFSYIVDAIAEFENSDEVSPFSSKYDAFLAGKVALTKQEAWGLKLFEDEKKGNCAACHMSQPDELNESPLFTDFSYDNLGLPANPVAQTLSAEKAVDLGLGKTVKNVAENGKFKVSTLRNIELTAPYMHNGIIADLTEAVQFYNQRDMSDRWGEPEYKVTMNTEELGHLHMSDEEVAAIVAFMKTLTDGYVAPEKN